ncbi:MarR family winged helix-turn-helix transcriptional regulator [Nocardia transvalensis]|uniref:MarR family winged helix-turn-helix transcriptional regulator n=1 Tax=Nocardia transvalensis TaxID=37333 RepID=UPI0018961DF4|nr:MarR family transcriptional regulator [Nocardia transvalensis]MBF6328035.1 MarR family transcriptional regulator [Nocardia transvalensis]
MTDALSLNQQVCFPLYAALRAITAVYRPKLEALGLTYPQYLVMLVLWEQDERNVGELSAALALDSGTLSPLLKRLEAAGLVERHRSAADERRVEIRLTERGRALREQACAIPAEMLEATGMQLEELVALRETLQRMTASLTSHIR